MKEPEYTPEESRAIYLASLVFFACLASFIAGGAIVYLLTH